MDKGIFFTLFVWAAALSLTPTAGTWYEKPEQFCRNAFKGRKQAFYRSIAGA